mgnify:FL=1
MKIDILNLAAGSIKSVDDVLDDFLNFRCVVNVKFFFIGIQDSQRAVEPHLCSCFAQDPIDDRTFRLFVIGDPRCVGRNVIFLPELSSRTR